MSHESEWDRRYASTTHWGGTHPDAALVELAGPLMPARAIDLGAGEGRNSLWLARRGWQVVAVDSSSVAVNRLDAAAIAEGLSVTVVHAEILTFLDQAEVFDLVVLANLHPAPGERATLFTAAAGAVAPEGHLFVVGHHLDSLGLAGPPDPTKLYTEQVLRTAVPELEILVLERRERLREAGTDPLVDVVLWAVATNREHPRDKRSNAGCEEPSG